jgi:hypothetical protein
MLITHKEYIKRLLQRQPENKLKEQIDGIEMFVGLKAIGSGVAANCCATMA